MHVPKIHRVLSATRDYFSSANGLGVSGAQADGERARLFGYSADTL